jgi:methylglutaconyl-CoA hydratase
MTWQTLETHLDQSGCLYITLNRPEVYNALNEVMIQEFITILEGHHSKPDIRALILQGAGKLFCSGADLGWMKKMAQFNDQQNVEDAKALAQLMHLWDTFPRPTVALIQGGAYGGAVGLAAAADIVIAHNDAVFCLSEVKLGLIPAVISPYVIKAIGQRQMRRYALTAEKMSASAALHLGLVHDIRDNLTAGLVEILDHILVGGPDAQAATKTLIRQVESKVIDDKIHHLTAESIAKARASKEGREGVQAFFEKRQPSWAQRKEIHP